VFFYQSEFSEFTCCWIFLPCFTTYGVLNYDTIIWLDGAWSANTCSHPPSWKHFSLVSQHTHPKQYICKYLKNSKIWQNQFFNKLKQRSQKEFDNLTFCSSQAWNWLKSKCQQTLSVTCSATCWLKLAADWDWKWQFYDRTSCFE
jgi:hypothetical protein